MESPNRPTQKFPVYLLAVLSLIGFLFFPDYQIQIEPLTSSIFWKYAFQIAIFWGILLSGIWLLSKGKIDSIWIVKAPFLVFWLVPVSMHFLNTWLDLLPPSIYRLPVASKAKIWAHPRGMSKHNSVLTTISVPSWYQRGEFSDINVSLNTYKKITPGRDFVYIESGPGRWGVRWFRYFLEDAGRIRFAGKKVLSLEDTEPILKQKQPTIGERQEMTYREILEKYHAIDWVKNHRRHRSKEEWQCEKKFSDLASSEASQAANSEKARTAEITVYQDWVQQCPCFSSYRALLYHLVSAGRENEAAQYLARLPSDLSPALEFRVLADLIPAIQASDDPEIKTSLRERGEDYLQAIARVEILLTRKPKQR